MPRLVARESSIKPVFLGALKGPAIMRSLQLRRRSPSPCVETIGDLLFASAGIDLQQLNTTRARRFPPIWEARRASGPALTQVRAPSSLSAAPLGVILTSFRPFKLRNYDEDVAVCWRCVSAPRVARDERDLLWGWIQWRSEDRRDSISGAKVCAASRVGEGGVVRGVQCVGGGRGLAPFNRR
jgi:hypothetical protein